MEKLSGLLWPIKYWSRWQLKVFYLIFIHKISKKISHKNALRMGHLCSGTCKSRSVLWILIVLVPVVHIHKTFKCTQQQTLRVNLHRNNLSKAGVTYGTFMVVTLQSKRFEGLYLLKSSVRRQIFNSCG